MKKHASLNRIFRLVWNDALGAVVAVAECAKGRGKGLSGGHVVFAHWRSRISQIAAWPSAPPFRPISIGVLCSLIGSTCAWAQILPDGRTQTTVSTAGAVSNVTTATQSGNNAFNSFSVFNVATGQTANLHVPQGASNLINLVSDAQSSIFGRLNAIKDGQIGGNVYFANPYGMVVGAGGVVNVGSLHVSTPTRAFVDGFFSSNGQVNEGSVAALLAGRAPNSGFGQINIQGTVNAAGEISLRAGAINVAGTLFSGARFEGRLPDFTDVVNANGLRSATNLIIEQGKISIVSDGDVELSGTLAAPGGSGVKGGDVSIQAGGNYNQNGGRIIAAGNGINSAGGAVNVWADGNSTLGRGALIDASAGSSGDGGFVEFSAAGTVELAGGHLEASATQGRAGSILIDPANLTISTDLLRSTSNTGGNGITWNAGSLTLQADEQLTIADDVVVSTRQVASQTRDGHINGISTGDSGNLTLEAADIKLGTGSMLLANSTNGYAAGDVSLTAKSEFSLLSSDSWSGQAKISLDGATIKGKDVTLAASSTYDDSALTYLLPVTVAVVGTSVDVKSSTLNASGNLSLNATSLTKASTSGVLPLGSTVAVSTATVDVSGASALSAGGDLKLNAASTVESKVAPGLPDLKKLPGDAGAAVNVIVSTTSTHVGGSTTLTAANGAAEVKATNKVTATTKADSSAEGVVAVGGTVALSEVTTVTKAYIDGTATTDAASLSVAAESQNTLTTSAKAAAKGANKQTEAEKAASPSLTEKILAKFKNQAKTTKGSVEVAAAVAIANVNSVTQAYIASTGKQKTTGATSVSSKATTSSSVTADGSSTNSEVGIGAAVGLNIGVLVNQASITDNSDIDSNGLTVSATMLTDTAKNTFATSATSGAGTSNVGVAGALGINVLVNTTSATIEDATVGAGSGDVLVEAKNAAASTVTSGAKVTPASTTQPAQVGVGVTVGTNVAVNTTTAKIADGAGITGGNNLGLTAKADNTVTTAATGGAAGDKVAVTPVAAVTVAVNTTNAHLGTGNLLDLTGNYTSIAEQKSTTSSTATGQTIGDKVAVGASIALTTATDTVTADIERDVTADGTFSVSAESVAKTTTSATASVKGGEKAKSDGKPPADASGKEKTVDEKVKDQGDSAKTVGSDTTGSDTTKKPSSALDLIKDLAAKVGLTGKANAASTASDTAAKPAASTPSTTDTAAKIETADTATEKPKAETSEGGVSVAAAAGINVAVTTTGATIGSGRKITSGGASTVSSTTNVDGSASADGSQVSNAQANVGVGAAVALNTAVVTNKAVIRDNAEINAHGLTVSAQLQKPEKTGFAALFDKFKSFIPGSTNPEANNFSATSKSGAGAGDVGVAGSLAVNTLITSSEAVIEGDKDVAGTTGYGTGAKLDAGGGKVTLEATNQATSKVIAQANVKNGSSGDPGTVGVGASIGVNVAVNTTRAEAEDKSKLTGAGAVDMDALSVYTQNTEVTGGAAGSKVSITPVAAVAIAVNTTTARLGQSTSTLDLTGNLNLDANQKNSVTTKATGQAEGDVAVGASLAAAVVVDHVSASLDRDLEAAGTVDIGAKSDTSLTTAAKAGAKGAAPVKKDPATGEEKPDAGTTVDEQKKTQLDFAKGKNTAATGVKTDTPDAKTPDVNTKTPDSTSKPDDTTTTNKDQKGKKVSVAAAIAVGVAYNEAVASIGAGRTIKAGTGKKLSVAAETDTNYTTFATGEAVSDNVGIAAAVGLTATMNKTNASIGAGTKIDRAGDVSVTASSRQNINSGFLRTMSAEANSGASGGDVAVAGSLAVVANDNETRASIDEGATLGTSSNTVGDVEVASNDASHIAAAARAGALSKGADSKAGVGASFAVLLAHNQNIAAVGRDADKNGSFAPTSIHADSLKIKADKQGVDSFLENGLSVSSVLAELKNINTKSYIDNLDPALYLGINYYTEAVAGAAAKGNAAVAGAFAVNVFGNTTQAYVGDAVSATLGGKNAAGTLGFEVDAVSDIVAASFAGGVAGAKKAGVGISTSDLINLDKTLASVGKNATILANGGGAKILADSQQTIVDIGISGGLGTESTGVGGVLGVALSLSKTEASIGDGSILKVRDALDVIAESDSIMVVAAGGVGGGKDAGVGASIAANVIANQTKATVGEKAELASTGKTTISADADETTVTAVIAGAGGGKAGVAGALSVNLVLTETVASVGQATKINTDAAYLSADQAVAISAHDDTVVVGVAGGAAGGGKAGVGAGIDTEVMIKTVKAFVADDTVVDGKQADIRAKKDVTVDATSTENIVSVSAGFGGGGTAGVGGAVGIGFVKNDVQAYVGQSAKVDTDSNVLINAQDDITAVLTAGAGAGGGTAGVGGSLAVATLIGSTKAFIGDHADVTARGLGDAATVYDGETVIARQPETPTKSGDLTAKKTTTAKGISVTAYNRENLITTAASGAGGGTAGVAATVSANVIANTAEAYIGRSAKINTSNTAAGADQQVRVKAIDETLLVDTAAGAGGGGTAGVGAGANVGVVAKTTKAWIGKSAEVNAKKAVDVSAASSAMTFTTTAGFAGGGSAGVGGSVAGVGVANTTQAYIEDALAADPATRIKVTGGDLSVKANDFATSWLITGSGAGGGAAGVGVSLAAGVNATTTLAKIGDYAETDAYGTTSVKADSTENVNMITVAGAGGGSAGVAGTISVNVVASTTEAGIGKYAKINQDSAVSDSSDQSVVVKATDTIIANSVGGAGAGGGAAGVGATINVLVAQNTTSAYIDNGATVDAKKDITVDASSDKYVNSATIAGAGGGAAGVAGAVSVIAVGSLFDDDAKSGLGDSNTSTYADGQLNKSAVKDSGTGNSQLGNSALAAGASDELDNKTGKLAVGKYMADTAKIPLHNTQAFIGKNAKVKAGENVDVTAKDSTLAIVASGAGAGGGAAGVAGAVGVVLLHDAAEAFIADGASVDAGKKLNVAAQTADNVFNVDITGSGAGAADVAAVIGVNVVTSNTSAYIGDANINKDSAMAAANTAQSIAVTAGSNSNLVTVAGTGGGAGAASVGGIVNVNTLAKNTSAFIGEGADVVADNDVDVSAASSQNLIGGSLAIRGAGAAAVSAVASTNVIANTTEAYIGSSRMDASKSAAIVDSNGNVRLAATDDSLIVAASAVGNGAGAAGVGVNVGANVISSQTRAYVAEGSTVNARGNADANEIYDGTLSSSPGAAATVPGNGAGNVDLNGDGVADGNVNGGVSFNVKAGNTENTVDPSKQGVGNKTVAGASGGIGAKGKTTAKGLSVTAVGNEKIISATIGIAGAGAAAVTGAASTNVVASQTEAYIEGGTSITNGTLGDVRVKAADNTFMVQTSGTISGAGAAAVSGSINTGIIDKKTHASIGDATITAANVEVKAAATESIYNVTANVSVAGAAGVGGAAGVNVVTNETYAKIGAGADVNAIGNINVNATQDTALDIYTVSGAGGGAAGVSGAASVGVIANVTQAFIAGSSDATNRTKIDAGKALTVTSLSEEEMTSATVSGAAGGFAGVAGAVGVKVVSSTTEAYIGDASQVNQRRSGATQDVLVQADDSVKLAGGGGTVALSGMAGVGATAEINVVRNTTTAYIAASSVVDADRDLTVAANSTKDVQSAAVAAAGGNSVGIGGALSVISIGAALDGDTQGRIGNADSFADSQMKQDKVGANLGSSNHVQGAKTEVARSGGLGVSSKLNETSTASLDKTRAFIGSGSQVTSGRAVKVAASDKLKVDANAVGAAGGAVGIGGAVSVAVANSTTEAFIGSGTTVDAVGNVDVTANAANVDSTGALVRSAAGAGGIVGASAAVAVMNDHSKTSAYLDDGAEIKRAADLSVTAHTNHKARAEALGASAGGLAIGASEAYSRFDGSTTAYADTDVQIGKTAGKTVSNVLIEATDDSTAVSRAVAGSAGIYSGAGAAAQSIMKSTVSASLEDRADVEVQSTLAVSAASAASASAEAVGVSVGYGAVGVSSAVATVDNDVTAGIGSDGKIKANQLNVHAMTALPTASGLTAKALSYGASGGLVGINGTSSVATYSGSTHSTIGDGTTVTGSAEVQATTNSKQQANASGVAVGGWLAVGANIAVATSDSNTQADIGKDVEVTGTSLAVKALGADENNANAISGSGGLVAGAASSATTISKSNMLAHIGQDSTVIAENVVLNATHTMRFNSSADSFQAAAFGASGALARNTAESTVTASTGSGVTLDAAEIDIEAKNIVRKAALAGNNAQAAAGGLLNGAAAFSNTTVSNYTSALVGENARFTADRAGASQGSVSIAASNDVELNDTARLDTGGAVAVALSESKIVSTTNQATVDIGAGAEIVSDGEVTLATQAKLTANAYVRAKTYGVAGAAAGRSTASLGADNAIKVGAGARVQSDGGDVNLLAGSGNKLQANADTRLWNHTALPIVTDPDADARIVQHNTIDIATGAKVRAHQDVNLTATEGQHKATGYGEGTDSYREVLSAIGEFFGADTSSLKITGGSSYDNAGSWSNLSSGVNVNGTVEAGIHHLQYLTLGANGTTVEKQSEGVSYTLEDNVKLADLLQSEIDALRVKANATRAAATDYSGTNAADAALALDNDADILEAQLSALDSSVRVGFMHVNPVLAQSGNVNVTGKYLTGTNGTLNAPGDVRIDIENKSLRFLTTSSLLIPDDKGGQVTFNGLGISSTADINARNQGGKTASNMTVLSADTSPKPVISVLNTNGNNSPTGEPAQLWMLGDVTNLRGEAVANSEGTIRVSAHIDAETVNIATSGDIIQTYTPGFTHQGGNPISQLGTLPDIREAAKIDYSTDTLAVRDCGSDGKGCSSSIAGQNVYISGEKLNINGLIQAGLPDRALAIDANLLSALNPTFNTKTNTQAISELRTKWSNGDHSVRFLALNAPLAGSSSIKVSYDAENDRLQLDNVRMGGGHMELFGNIFSTGNGQLNVMDGYGRINITNSSSYDLAVGRLDTSGGVEGTIKITDTSKRDAHNKPLVTQITRLGNLIEERSSQTVDAEGKPTYLVSSATGRNTTFQPTQNRRFNWINGRTTTLDEDRVYTSRILFGADWLVADYDNPDSSTTSAAYRQRLTGDWLSIGGGTANYAMDYSTYSTGAYKYRGDSTSRYGVVCIADACAYEEVTTHAYFRTITQEYFQHSLNASKSIGIGFIGYDTASLNVNSVNGQLLLGGLARAVNGTTTLNGNSGIQSLSSDASIAASDLRMTSANGAIGSASKPINIDLTDTVITPALINGTVTATGRNGVALKEIAGDLRVAAVNASQGDISLIADRNLVAPTNTVVTGNSISLVALSGNVGDAGAPIRVETQGSTSTLSASAAGEINIAEQTGDLRVNQVKSAAGDVRLSAPGSLLDGNTVESVDEKSRAELLALWGAMELTGGGADAARDRNLAAQENGLKASYETYFRMRHLRLNDDGITYTADAYNPNFAYKLAENQAAALREANGWNSDQLAEHERSQTAQYHASYARFGGGAYTANFEARLTVEEIAATSAGYKWSDEQLTNAIGAGILKETSDTNIRIEDPNVVGTNVNLVAGGDIGSKLGVVTIGKGTAFSSLSDTQKLALLTAESNDLTVTDTGITIVQRDDFNVTARGELNASAAGAQGVIHIGSEEQVLIGEIASPQEVRIKTSQGLSAKAGVTNVTANDIVLEAGRGDLGKDGAAILINTTGGKFTARAGGNLNVEEVSGDLRVESVFAKGNATLKADGSILESKTDSSVDVRADNVSLIAGAVGNIGLSGENQSLDVGVDINGMVNAVASQGIYLAGPIDQNFIVGDITAGTVALLRSAADARIVGKVHATSDLGVIVAGNASMAPGSLLKSDSGNIELSADSFSMADGSKVHADAGTITVNAQRDIIIGQIEATHNATADAIRITTDGRILDGGDTGGDDLIASTAGARLTMNAKGGIGVAKVSTSDIDVSVKDPLEINVAELEAGSSAGSILVDSNSPLNFTTVQAGLDVSLTADGSVSGSNVSAGRDVVIKSMNDLKVGDLTAKTGNAIVVAGRNIEADSISAGELADLNAVAGDLKVNQITSRSMTLAAGGNLSLGTLSADTALSFSSSSLTANIVHKGTGSPLLLSITGPGGGIASLIDLDLSSPVGVQFARLSTMDSSIRMLSGYLQIDSGYIGNVARFQNPVTDLVMDNNSYAVRSVDVQLYVPGKSFSGFKLDGWTTIAGPYVINRDPDHGVQMGSLRDSSALEESRSGIEGKVGTPRVASMAPLAMGGENGIRLIGSLEGVKAAVQMVDIENDNQQVVEE